MKNKILLLIAIAIISIAFQYDTIISYLLLLTGSMLAGYSITKMFEIPIQKFIKKHFKISKIEILIIAIVFLVAFVYPTIEVYKMYKPYFSVTRITLVLSVVYTGFLLWYFLLKATFNYLSKKK